MPFGARFGAQAEDFVGKPIHRLIAQADQGCLRQALAHATVQGRLPPMVLRLNDAAQTPFSFAAMRALGSP